MNKSFKHIWSKKQGRYVVASEVSKSQGGGFSSMSRAVLLALGLVSASGQAQTVANNALPTNPSIASGAATITQNANKLTINQATDKLITNWSTFNIGKDAAVQFVQPSVTSSALNRINSSDPSYIYGTLSANGQVLFINQSGVVFAPGARVDAASIVTSTLNLLDSNYLNNNLVFEKNVTAGSISNAGSINALVGGTVALIAPQVTNTGSITADSGSVALLAADKVTLALEGNRLIRYSLDQGTLNALIQNSGSVRANDGVVVLSAKALDALNKSLVNNTGVIEAKGITQDGGRVYLDAEGGVANNSGTIDVSSDVAYGGLIQVTGDEVNVKTGSVLLAKGFYGGGTINIGGSYQNSDTSVRQAIKTTVEDGVLIDASALENSFGDGGVIAIWSNIKLPESVTSVSGNLISRAGAWGGNGGRVETSGYLLNIKDAIRVDTTAAMGAVGNWLLDPFDITIGNSGSDSGASYTASTTSSLKASSIASQLATSNVTISTGAGSYSPYVGSVSYTRYATALTSVPLSSRQDSSTSKLNGENLLITWNSTSTRIKAGPTGSITSSGLYVWVCSNPASLSTCQASSVSLTRGTTSSTVTFSASSLGDGNTPFYIVSGYYSSSGTLSSRSSSYTGTYRTSDPTQDAGNITINTGISVASGNANTLELIANGAILGSGNLTNIGRVIFNNSGGGTYSGVIDGATIVEKKGGGTQVLSANQTYTGGTIVTAGNLAFDGTLGGGTYAGNISLTGNLTYAGGSNQTFSGIVSGTGDLLLSPSSGTSTLTLSNTGNTHTGSLSILSGTLKGTGNLASSSSESIDTNDTGIFIYQRDGVNLTVDRKISGVGQVQVSGTGALLLSNSGSDFDGAITIGSGSTLAISGAGVLGYDTTNTGLTSGVPADFTSNISNSGILNYSSSAYQKFSGVISGSGVLVKDTNTSSILTLAGANTYTGSTTISAGTISVSSLANGGSSSNIGQSGSGATNLVLDGGTLKYTGSAVSTNRLFTLTDNGGTIDASGTGALTFSGAGAIAYSGTSAKTFIKTKLIHH